MKVLVIDDELDVQLLFKQKFRKEIRNNSVQFEFAFSGEEALEKLQGMAHESLLILSDINMPGMNGLQLLAKIKERYTAPEPRVMMITAYDDETNYNTAMKLGADDFQTKPVNFAVLKQKITPTL